MFGALQDRGRCSSSCQWICNIIYIYIYIYIHNYIGVLDLYLSYIYIFHDMHTNTYTCTRSWISHLGGSRKKTMDLLDVVRGCAALGCHVSMGDLQDPRMGWYVSSITHRIHGAGILMLTWLGYIDGIHVTIHSSTMDPMGYKTIFCGDIPWTIGLKNRPY